MFIFGSDPSSGVAFPGEAISADALLLLAGATLLGFALATLKPGSRLRRAYGVAVDDDAAARSNAAVLGLVGTGVLLLAWVIAADVPDRVVGVTVLLASGVLCLVLGWLVRYRDRHELLTVPDPDPRTARRLGGAVMICGVLLLPLAPALWFGVGDALVVVLALGGSLAGLVAVAVAVR